MFWSFWGSTPAHRGYRQFTGVEDNPGLSEASLLPASRWAAQLPEECTTTAGSAKTLQEDLFLEGRIRSSWRGWPGTSTWVLIATTMLLICIVAGLIINYGWLQTTKRVIGECDCGDSVVQARAAGCKWDVLASAWLPEKCIDAELTMIFRSKSPDTDDWKYYADADGAGQLNETEVSLLADDLSNEYWVSAEWHRLHCTFYWKKKYRSQFTGGLVELRFDNFAHILHCERILLGQVGAEHGTLFPQTANLRSDVDPSGEITT